MGCFSLSRIVHLVESQFRVYALTEASKYVLVFFGILATSSLGTGLWLVSVPSAKGGTPAQYFFFASDLPPRPAIQFPEIHLDPFRACVFNAPEVAEWAYRSQVAFAGIYRFIFHRYLGT